MRLDILVASTPMMLFCAAVLGASAKLSPADETAAFKAAGYTLKGKQWRACNDPHALLHARGSRGSARRQW